KGVNKAPQGCWHDLVVSALQPLSEEDSDADGKIWRFRKHAQGLTADTSRQTNKQNALPSWLMAKAPTAPPAPMILRPSDAADREPRAFSAGDTREVALLRGTLAHRLLQSLSDIPASRREKVAGEFLSRRGKKLSHDQRTALIQEVLRIVENKDFAELFAPG